MYELIKALHIIFIVTWFSGLFYIVRLFVYFSEAQDLPEASKNILSRQFSLMQKRLWYGITWPSAIITLILGPALWYQYGSFDLWLKVKLFFVFFLYLYHYFCHQIFLKQQKGLKAMSSKGLRILNEGASVFLFIIVFLAVYKTINAWKAALGTFLLISVLGMGILVYAKKRKKEY